MTNLFIGATRQHVGKSTTSLGLIAALLRRAPPSSVAYMKPVGQQHVTVDGAQIDKDCLLAKEFFGLDCPYPDMSPVLMPRGYTKRFIDGKVDPRQQEAAVLRAWERLQAAYPNVVVEGTGHMGVGSIVGLDNARVASLLGLDVALVCEGGLGADRGAAGRRLATDAATRRHLAPARRTRCLYPTRSPMPWRYALRSRPRRPPTS